MYRLIFLTGKNKGRRLAIQEGSILVGRDPECHIQLRDDDEVSRRHAVLREQDGTVLIEDAGSLNKILINDREVRQATLENGDVIELGRTRLQFQSVRGKRLIERRNLGVLQRLTIAGVMLIMITEFAYLTALSLWHNRIFDLSDVESNRTNAPSAGPIREMESAVSPDEEADVMSEAEARLRQLEEQQAALEPIRPLDGEPSMDDVAGELQQLKADVATIKEQVQGLTPAVPEPVAAATPEPPSASPTPPAFDPVLKKAEEMLQEALIEIQRMNLDRADEQFARIQLLAPDYLPAYMERARLYERRGKLKEAGEQWTAVMNRSAGDKIYEQAAAERIRVSRAEMIRTALQTSSSDSDTPARLPRRIRIDSVEPQKFPGNDQFDEMRLLRITLKSRATDRDIDIAQVMVVVHFFDQGLKTGDIYPSEVLVPKEPLLAKGEGGSQRVVTAAYVVPKNHRKEEMERSGEQRRYYGYVIRVVYEGAVQDQEARPRSLFKQPLQLPDAPGSSSPDPAS